MKREKLQPLRSDFVSAGRGTTPTSPGHRGATTVGTRAHEAYFFSTCTRANVHIQIAVKCRWISVIRGSLSQSPQIDILTISVYDYKPGLRAKCTVGLSKSRAAEPVIVPRCRSYPNGDRLRQAMPEGRCRSLRPSWERALARDGFGRKPRIPAEEALR